MYYFASAIKSYLAPVMALQVAQQVLVNEGFQVFDPVQPGKLTLAGTHQNAGLMVTVVSLDCEGGSATVANAFCVHEMSTQSAQAMANMIYSAIQSS
ncbi:MAG: hypothetical protein EBZ59_00200 [Planctomycetia bacterium]|nr:hypothetical protein [Planctomycetia bacterium]